MTVLARAIGRRRRGGTRKPRRHGGRRGIRQGVLSRRSAEGGDLRAQAALGARGLVGMDDPLAGGAVQQRRGLAKSGGARRGVVSGAHLLEGSAHLGPELAVALGADRAGPHPLFGGLYV